MIEVVRYTGSPGMVLDNTSRAVTVTVVLPWLLDATLLPGLAVMLDVVLSGGPRVKTTLAPTDSPPTDRPNVWACTVTVVARLTTFPLTSVCAPDAGVKVVLMPEAVKVAG